MVFSLSDPYGRLVMRGRTLQKDLIVMLGDLILGLTTSVEKYNDEKLMKHAKRGFFHALSVASTLAGKTGRRVLVCVLDKEYNGVAVSVDPNVAVHERVEVCFIKLAFPVECSRELTRIEWSPEDKISKVCIYLL